MVYTYVNVTNETSTGSAIAPLKIMGWGFLWQSLICHGVSPYSVYPTICIKHLQAG